MIGYIQQCNLNVSKKLGEIRCVYRGYMGQMGVTWVMGLSSLWDRHRTNSWPRDKGVF